MKMRLTRQMVKETYLEETFTYFDTEKDEIKNILSTLLDFLLNEKEDIYSFLQEIQEFFTGFEINYTNLINKAEAKKNLKSSLEEKFAPLKFKVDARMFGEKPKMIIYFMIPNEISYLNPTINIMNIDIQIDSFIKAYLIHTPYEDKYAIYPLLSIDKKNNESQFEFLKLIKAKS